MFISDKFTNGMLLLSHVRLFVTPWTVARQAPVVHGILQARKLEWVAISFSRVLPDPGNEPAPALAGRSFTTGATQEACTHRLHVKVKNKN